MSDTRARAEQCAFDIYVAIMDAQDAAYDSRPHTQRVLDAYVAYAVAQAVKERDGHIEDLSWTNAEQAEEIARLRAALDRYGDHTWTCRYLGTGCTCGLAALRAPGQP